MISTPRYNSHAQQQAMLGSAANLCPDKHPRRFARYKARQRLAKEVGYLDHESSLSGIAMARARLEQIRHERRVKQAERLRPLAATGATISSMAAELGSTPRTIHSLLDEFKLPRSATPPAEA